MKSPTLQPLVRTMFADLVQQVEAAPVGGSLYQRERDGIIYIYVKIPVGRIRIDRFVGKVGEPEAEARATAYRQGANLAKARREIVSMLKRHKLAGPDKTLGAACWYERTGEHTPACLRSRINVA